MVISWTSIIWSDVNVGEERIALGAILLTVVYTFVYNRLVIFCQHLPVLIKLLGTKSTPPSMVLEKIPFQNINQAVMKSGHASSSRRLRQKGKTFHLHECGRVRRISKIKNFLNRNSGFTVRRLYCTKSKTETRETFPLYQTWFRFWSVENY